MGCSMPGLPVHNQLPELAQTHVHQVSDAIQPSHPLSSPSPPAFNLSQHQGLFRWVSSSHQVDEKCKSKAQWDITSHWSEWPSSKSLQTVNAGEGVEKMEHSCTVDGNVNWCSHYGRWLEVPLKTGNKSIIWPSNPTPRHISLGNQNWTRHMYPIIQCSTIYSS